LQSLGLTPPEAGALGAADIDASMSAVQIAFANLRMH
jgi:hypothetical protein